MSVHVREKHHVVRAKHSYKAKQNSLSPVPLGFAVAIPCVMSNRLIINLRAVARRRTVLTSSSDAMLEEVLGADETLHTGAPITFARNPDTP
ncbi:hypothetical protein CPC08DRAFT_769767 [Agrocybe pediades]|nr:hypothetical protein CPC08DRAFT_769767 [Agrocybe pediades]